MASSFDFLSQSLRLEWLRELPEERLRKDLVIPLYQKIAHGKVLDNHGANEFGKDVVILGTDTKGATMTTAIVLKAGDVSQGSGRGKSQEIIRQIDEAATCPWMDRDSGANWMMNKIIVIASGKVKANPQKAIACYRKGHYPGHEFEIIEGMQLLAMLEEHIPQKLRNCHLAYGRSPGYVTMSERRVRTKNGLAVRHLMTARVTKTEARSILKSAKSGRKRDEMHEIYELTGGFESVLKRIRTSLDSGLPVQALAVSASGDVISQMLVGLKTAEKLLLKTASHFGLPIPISTLAAVIGVPHDNCLRLAREIASTGLIEMLPGDVLEGPVDVQLIQVADDIRDMFRISTSKEEATEIKTKICAASNKAPFVSILNFGEAVGQALELRSPRLICDVLSYSGRQILDTPHWYHVRVIAESLLGFIERHRLIDAKPDCLYFCGQYFCRAGQKAKALRIWLALERELRGSGDFDALIRTINDKAIAFLNSGDEREYSKGIRRTLHLAKKHKDALRGETLELVDQNHALSIMDNQPQKAHDILVGIQERRSERGDLTEDAQLSVNIANCRIALGEFESAEAVLGQALSEAREQKSSDAMVGAILGLIACKATKGDTDSAIDLLSEGLNTARWVGSERGMRLLLGDLPKLVPSASIERFTVFDDCVAAAIELGWREDAAMLLALMATRAAQLDNLDLADDYSRTALREARKLRDPGVLAEALQSRYYILLLRKRYRPAKVYALECRGINEQHKSSEVFLLLSEGMALELSDRRLPRAVITLSDVFLPMFEERKQFCDLAGWHSILSECWIGVGQSKRAYQASDLAVKYALKCGQADVISEAYEAMAVAALKLDRQDSAQKCYDECVKAAGKDHKRLVDLHMKMGECFWKGNISDKCQAVRFFLMGYAHWLAVEHESIVEDPMNILHPTRRWYDVVLPRLVLLKDRGHTRSFKAVLEAMETTLDEVLPGFRRIFQPTIDYLKSLLN